MSSHKSRKITHFVDLLMIIFNDPLKLETINSLKTYIKLTTLLCFWTFFNFHSNNFLRPDRTHLSVLMSILIEFLLISISRSSIIGDDFVMFEKSNLTTNKTLFTISNKIHNVILIY